MPRATRQAYFVRGMTLIEMIIVIVISGVLVAFVSLFGQSQVAAYVDTANRSTLADAADTALRRITRELQSALPNSVRASGAFLEFVPVRDGGRYRVAQTPLGVGDILDIDAPADTTFDLIGPPVSTVVGDRLVIYNLGQLDSDVYAGSSSRALSTIGVSLTTLTYVGVKFPFGSPQHRFQIVGGPVTYECDLVARVLRRRWCYNFQAAQPLVFGGLPVHPDPACVAEQSAVLVGSVDACIIAYTPGVLTRNGLVTVALTLGENGESVTLRHQVEILNAP